MQIYLTAFSTREVTAKCCHCRLVRGWNIMKAHPLTRLTFKASSVPLSRKFLIHLESLRYVHKAKRVFVFLLFQTRHECEVENVTHSG